MAVEFSVDEILTKGRLFIKRTLRRMFSPILQERDYGQVSSKFIRTNPRRVYDYLTALYFNDTSRFKDDIYEEFGANRPFSVLSIFNPVKRIVDFYQPAFQGKFGKELQIEGIESGLAEMEEIPLNPKIIEPIQQIIKDSNLDIESNKLTFFAALYGYVVLPITTEEGKIKINVIPPYRVRNFSLDNASQLQSLTFYKEKEIVELDLKNKVLNHNIKVKETFILTKENIISGIDRTIENFITQDEESVGFGGFEDLTISDNVLGIIPAEIAYFSKPDTKYGSWSFIGIEDKLSWANALLEKVYTIISKNVKPLIVLTSPKKPNELANINGDKVLYVNSSASENSSFELKSLPLDLKVGDALQVIEKTIELIEVDYPELLFTNLRGRSNQSAEYIKELRKPCEQKVLNLREQLENALVNAIKKALIIGVNNGNWDLGTGLGTGAAIKLIEDDSLISFRFKNRPAFPEDTEDILKRMELELKIEALENQSEQPSDSAENSTDGESSESDVTDEKTDLSALDMSESE